MLGLWNNINCRLPEGEIMREYIYIKWTKKGDKIFMANLYKYKSKKLSNER